jgi:hypothetical protein
VRVTRTRRWCRPHTLRFEGLAETHARTWPRRGQHLPVQQPERRCGVVACPRSGAVRSLDDCVHCEHFVNLRPDADHQGATLRCLLCDDDPLPRRVRGASTWDVVAPELPVEAARLVSWATGVSLLVVARAEEVVGVVHVGRLQDALGCVGDHMIVEPWSLPSVATVGDAVEAIATLHVPGLLVVDTELELVSVVSTTDLRRMGVPAALLAR